MAKMRRDEWGGKIFYSHGETNSRGAAILTKTRLQYKVNKIVKDKEGHFLAVDISLDNDSLTLCNIYAPNQDTPDFFIKVGDIMDQFQSPHRVIGGDFNLCFDVNLDKRGTTHNNVKLLEVLREYMEENYMVDILHIKNPSKFNFTWKRDAPTLATCRLDYFIVTTGTLGWREQVYITPGYKTDHSLIGIVLEPVEIQRGPGY